MSEYGKPIYGTVKVPDPVVDTPCGKVKGISRDGIALFRGIPYGEPVDGAGRFLPPKKKEPWEGVLDCTENGPTAMQFGTAGGVLPYYFTAGHPEKFGIIEGNDRSGERDLELPCVRSENCLTAGVMTPGIDDKKRPVLVYIHGGGFSTGSGVLIYGADDYVKEQDLVLVCLHHRLNVFGYMYLGAFDKKYESSGMAGMLDLVLGLQWVRDNIACFGGDPEKVTILGESGGAMKICTLLNMPVAKDLFRYAIIESGSGKVGYDNREEAAKAAKTVLDNLGIKETELEKLQDFSSEEILNAAEPVLRAFRPVPDDIYLKAQKYPSFAYEDCAKDKIILVGSSEDEMASFPGPGDLEPVTEENLEERMHAALNRGVMGMPPEREYSMEDTRRIIETFRSVTGESAPEQTYWNVLSLKGMLGGGAYYQALERAVMGGAKVFAYYNALDVPDTVDPDKRFAWHVSDLALQFGIVAYDFCKEASRIQTAAWAAFVRNGDPSTEELPWPAYTALSQKILRIGEKSGIVNDYRRELLKALE